MLQAHLDWAGQRLGPDVLDRIRPRLSPEGRAQLDRPLLASRLYPFRLLIELDRTIASLAGGNEADVFRQLGEHSAQINLSTVYRVFNKQQPHEFFERAAQLHSRFQDFGRAEYERTGDTSCRLTLHDCASHSKVFCRSALGYYVESTRLQGGKDIRVVERTCTCDGADACRFEISWT